MMTYYIQSLVKKRSWATKYSMKAGRRTDRIRKLDAIDIKKWCNAVCKLLKNIKLIWPPPSTRTKLNLKTYVFLLVCSTKLGQDTHEK